jgi:hypothetical protein
VIIGRGVLGLKLPWRVLCVLWLLTFSEDRLEEDLEVERGLRGRVKALVRRELMMKTRYDEGHKRVNGGGMMSMSNEK